MPQDEQFEWPSFETVLRDVATSDPARPSTSTATPEKPQETPVVPAADQLDVEPEWTTAPADTLDDLIPEPLAPLDFDTSVVRALLEPRETAPSIDFELDALAPLAPPSTLDLAAETDLKESGEPVASAAVEPVVEVFEPDSVFDLAFEADDYLPSEDLQAAVDHQEPVADAFAETPILDEVEGIELPDVTEAPTEVFDDLGLNEELSFEAVPEFADGEVADDEDASSPSPIDSKSIDDLPSGAVFQLDESTISDVEPEPLEAFSAPTIDLFDLQESSDEVESQRIEEFGEDLYAAGLIDQLSVEDSSTEFDSVATANAIEGELNELNDLSALEPDFDSDTSSGDDPFQLANVDLDNVIPLRRDVSESQSGEVEQDASPAASLNGPSPARISHTGWVGLDNDESSAAADEVDPDPWAHMRPTDEPVQQGFWAKVFGGDERKRAKARRLAQKQASESGSDDATDAGNVAFDSSCPNCGGQCQVDLDDPIGRRMHVSCPSCDHMWNTPYIDAPTG